MRSIRPHEKAGLRMRLESAAPGTETEGRMEAKKDYSNFHNHLQTSFNNLGTYED